MQKKLYLSPVMMSLFQNISIDDGLRLLFVLLGVVVVCVLLVMQLRVVGRYRRELAECRRELAECVAQQQSGREVQRRFEMEREREREDEKERELQRVREREQEFRELQRERRVEQEAEQIGLVAGEEYLHESMTHSDKLFVSRLTLYIEQNIDKSDLVVNSLCDFMGVTPLVLNKKLKLLVGMTAIVFIRTVRLRRAAMLLRTARYTVSDVTYDVGFSDLRYFRECFKREFGVLPQEYKDQSVSGVDESADEGGFEMNGGEE